MKPGLLLLWTYLLCQPMVAHALRCGDRLVDEGDLDIQVRSRCGEPFWMDSYPVVNIQGTGSLLETQLKTVYEEWFYNFGPRRFMMRLLFADGRLLSEDELGYGYSQLGQDCTEGAFARGVSTGELVARCGQPTSRRNNPAAIVRRDSVGNEHIRPRRNEEWIYDFSDHQFLRVLNIINGRIESVNELRR